MGAKYILVRERTIRQLEFFEALGPNANFAKPIHTHPFQTVVIQNTSTVCSAVLDNPPKDGWLRRIVQHLGGSTGLRLLDQQKKGRCDE